jgi:4a-hydroxytetrahydrobiopterin dehydratase
MSRPVKLSEAEIQAKLESLPGWSLREGKLHRQFQFRSFRRSLWLDEQCGLGG